LAKTNRIESTQDAILGLVRDQGLIRFLDLDVRGLSLVFLTRLIRQGQLASIGHLLYAPPDRPVSEHSALAEVTRKHTQTVVCLFSALRFHEVRTQAPFEVWLAIPNKARASRLDNLVPIRAA
jgi:predicted transcriptional regulator of viral defense system